MNSHPGLVLASTLLKFSGILMLCTACLCMVNAAEEVSPSQVLEKAIYSEETKGDLEGAMTLYKQVVSEAKGYGIGGGAGAVSSWARVITKRTSSPRPTLLSRSW